MAKQYFDYPLEQGLRQHFPCVRTSDARILIIH